MVATPQPQRDANPDKLELRQLLENSFHNHDLVTLAPAARCLCSKVTSGSWCAA